MLFSYFSSCAFFLYILAVSFNEQNQACVPNSVPEFTLVKMIEFIVFLVLIFRYIFQKLPISKMTTAYIYTGFTHITFLVYRVTKKSFLLEVCSCLTVFGLRWVAVLKLSSTRQLLQLPYCSKVWMDLHVASYS